MTRARLAYSLGMLTLVAGMVVTVGWILDIAVIENLGPTQRTMSPVTAVTLGISSISLLVYLTRRRTWTFRVVRVVTACTTVLVGVATLTGYFLGQDWAITDALFFGLVEHQRATPTSGLNLIFLGWSLIFLGEFAKRRHQIGSKLVIISIFLSLLDAVSYM